ncbi:MAG: hypothetical protein WC607_04700 [Candidatus Micrarchaeia archaeon]
MPNVEARKTPLGLMRLGSRIKFYEGEPYYLGRRVITRDSPILNGVYLGANEREAIVVHDSPALKALFEAAKERAQLESLNPREKEDRILEAVYDTVRQKVPALSPEQVDELLRENNVKPDEKVSLDSFLENGGECRHLNLAIAALLEKFKNEGHLPGKVSVERNRVKGVGGHAWAGYEHSDGKKRIADAVQNYLGLQEHATNWPYLLHRR